ncbi:MAG: hypothetical protein COV74_01670 [Candidatus Omnitrophica bacterium CG11_big_fil_rev_8_21_14_0_20_45_26]|uniref:ACT domain-containing protein n=1 Tax=Candidatus Abzuiibacterium crystallinum TaxID=1974748 RepID=A0A2H0LUT5_9BACT|nr:MAG: hypothetical protein COV74_01670 [Candidatus Omnitrophica bacterium CG11_big_fil_rev_8_21_14_0_20_45_26]PIW65004.1 MAG: hypothetical protein COW12_03950 [Candidatus Omnitrophica bacterium CG12_big_fil_rev_8_21_14_0_65_45_16]
MKLCVTVSGKDQSGIIADVTSVFYRLKGNLQDATMSILCGEFAMIFIVALPSQKQLSVLESYLKRLEAKRKLSIDIRPLSPAKKKKIPHATQYEMPYYVSIFGEDRAGIVYHVSHLLASRGLNITDLNSKLIQMGKKKIYGLALEVDIPKSKDIKSVEKGLRQVAKRYRADLVFKPVEPLPL